MNTTELNWQSFYQYFLDVTFAINFRRDSACILNSDCHSINLQCTKFQVITILHIFKCWGLELHSVISVRLSPVMNFRAANLQLQEVEESSIFVAGWECGLDYVQGSDSPAVEKLSYYEGGFPKPSMGGNCWKLFIISKAILPYYSSVRLVIYYYYHDVVLL